MSRPKKLILPGANGGVALVPGTYQMTLRGGPYASTRMIDPEKAPWPPPKYIDVDFGPERGRYRRMYQFDPQSTSKLQMREVVYEWVPQT